MNHSPQFDEAELITLIDRLVRFAPGLYGGNARVRQITQKQERYKGGYDAVVSSVLPFYVQAKTASFHREQSTSDIISARKNLGVNASPGAFSFYLRKHKGTTEPLQHNALYWMSLRSMAAYVCPTFWSETSLDLHLDNALTASRKNMWSYQEMEYLETGKRQKAKISARHFSGLFTIVPHRLVEHYLHRYSYCNKPNSAVVFHSEPEHVPDSKTLSGFLSSVEFPPKYSTENKYISVKSFGNLPIQWLEESFSNPDQGFRLSLADISQALYSGRISNSAEFSRIDSAIRYLSKLDWLDLSAFWGALLNEKFAIKQFLATQTAE